MNKCLVFGAVGMIISIYGLVILLSLIFILKYFFVIPITIDVL